MKEAEKKVANSALHEENDAWRAAMVLESMLCLKENKEGKLVKEGNNTKGGYALQL